MNWDKFLVWLRIKKSGAPVVVNFDQKLVGRWRRRVFPNWSQLKYVGQFLNRTEKITLGATGAIMLVVAIGWLGLFIKAHSGLGPKDGGEYSEAMVGQPKYINPLFASANENDVDSDLTALIYSGLFVYDNKQQLVPYLAKRYAVSADGKAYDVYLRQDVRWSDNEQFDADDVVYTFDAIQNPEVGSPLLPSFQGIKVEKIGQFQVRFTLKESFAPFLSSLTVGILPEHIWSEVTPASMKLASTNLQPIGAGLWVFSRLVKDDLGTIRTYVLTRNESFFGKKPHFKSATFKFFDDYNQAAEALRSQSVSALNFLPQALAGKLASKSFNLYNLKLPQYTALFFNSNSQPALTNLDLRVALTEAVDKRALVAKALSGAGEVVEAPILERNLGYAPNLDKITFDPVAANSLLDKVWARIQPEEYFKIRQGELNKRATSTISEEERRLAEQVDNLVRKEMNPDQTFYRKNKDGKILSLTITTVDSGEYRSVAEMVAQMWRKLGIITKVEVVSSRQILREIIKPRQYEVLLYGEMEGNDPDLFPFWHSSQVDYPGLNLSLYVNRNVDKLLEDARLTIDKDQRASLYKKLQTLLIADRPAIFLYTPTYIFAANKDIKGITLNRLVSPANRYDDLANWYNKTKWVWK